MWLDKSVTSLTVGKMYKDFILEPKKKVFLFFY